MASAVNTILLALITYDQVMYALRKGSLAGPKFKIPFMGPFLQALHPKFDNYLAQWKSGPLSFFKSPGYTKPCIVPIAPDIIGSDSLIFLQGKAHTEYRRGLTGLFTNKALGTYSFVQEHVYAEYFDRFVATTAASNGKSTKFMALFRKINCALSCRTFFGDYISQDAVKKIANEFYLITAALELVNIPLSMYIPFTKTWWGKRTAVEVQTEFTKCAAACKVNMSTGSAPTCIVDQWVLHMMESEKYRSRVATSEDEVPKPTNLIRTFTDEEIAQTLFACLFASQDASSSATTWTFQILAQRPDVLQRIRDENLAARNGDRYRPFELSMYGHLTYTNAVVKELLRYRPPVIFAAMIIPSCYPALHDPVAYPNPEVFDPDRWIDGNAESKTKNWLVFGTGPHDCLARRYVPLTMAHMIGKAALEPGWVHHATEKSEEIRVFATLFLMDECPLTFTRRS
ncbi:cytochrome P450 [Setomelanomma holmii]|uniref:Cytochrome P450 n=1 Tax=Setomelanomma holmii TaxID=210430 RepID=A0A9P4H955_9PLEO|nr:cytochrome P450 [Setomelanomma holmii]